MPHASAKDGTRLFYEEAGSGTPLIFIHEFAGDHRSWEPQLRFFSRYMRCITYAARGFPPSDVPDDPGRYSQEHARDDVIAVLDQLKIERAHVVGLSMGGFAALHVGITHPQRARSLVIAGCGYGAEPDKKERFRAECEAAATSFEANWKEAAQKYTRTHPSPVPEQGPSRLGRVRAAARRAFAQGPGAHDARRADAPPLAVRAGRRHEENQRADPHRHRR